jgi:hypothetical protein
MTLPIWSRGTTLVTFTLVIPFGLAIARRALTPLFVLSVYSRVGIAEAIGPSLNVTPLVTLPIGSFCTAFVTLTMVTPFSLAIACGALTPFLVLAIDRRV